MLSSKRSLYIRGVSPLLNTWLTDVFTHSIACFSFFFLFFSQGLFLKQNFKISIKSNLSVFPFMDPTFDIKFKNSFCLTLYPKGYLLVFFLKVS